MNHRPASLFLAALSLAAAAGAVPGERPQISPELVPPVVVPAPVSSRHGHINPAKCHVIQAPLELRVGRRARRA